VELKFIVSAFIAMIASVAAFMPSPMASSVSNSALFAKAESGKEGEKKMAYVPAGLTREQYAEVLAKDEAQKNKKLEGKGGTGETLEEFQAENTEGYRVKHRFVKMKFPGWYANE
jgi:hypothetical protein